MTNTSIPSEKLRKSEALKRASAARKEYIINELFELNSELYLGQSLYGLGLAELERIHIDEKCKSHHAFRYRNLEGEK